MTAFRIEVPYANIERVSERDWADFCSLFAGSAPQAKITNTDRGYQVVEGTDTPPSIVTAVAAVAQGHELRRYLDHARAELAKPAVESELEL